MHEEDYGVLWRHMDLRTGQVEVRRSRRLVISSFSTIGNYDYGFFWYLYQDGTIQCEVKLTGILSTGARRAGERPALRPASARPASTRPHHQHFFNFRLDMDVDGQREHGRTRSTASPDPLGPENPYGQRVAHESTPLDARVARRSSSSTRCGRGTGGW